MHDFRIDVSKPANRELVVSARLTRDPTQDPAGRMEVFLPTWTPGSYLLREYSRQLSRVRAVDPQTGAELTIRKTSKNRFEIACGAVATVQLDYRVYAHELSVRTADVDDSHAFWNHACVLLWPVDDPDRPCTIQVTHPAEWSAACSLEPRTVHTEVADAAAFELRAANLDEVIDTPVLLGRLTSLEFEVDGVPHSIVLDGLGAVRPPDSLVDDLTRIVQAARNVFGGELPYRRYTFLALFAGEGHGGLEHRDSSVLLMSRTSLGSKRGYREFLGLAAHELFHAWNVKRLRPREFWTYDYEQENYTSLLWLMEGWTAYYDDLLVARAGLMSAEHYLAAMAKNVQGLLGSPGRRALSLAESSFDAWIRLYRPDENTRNSSQNYYGNGAVAAMCLDLTIRHATDGALSLDDVLRGLWRDTWQQGRGYTLDDVTDAVRQVAGEAAVAAMLAMVQGELEPDLDGILAHVGLGVVWADAGSPFLGVAFQQGTTVLASVNADGPAFAAGLAPGDELIAIEGVRVTAGNWQTVFSTLAHPDRPLQLLLARRGLVNTSTVTPSAGRGTPRLRVLEGATSEAHAARAAWLGSSKSTNEQDDDDSAES
ncbi:MAG: PDZ domain-containing protein [Planctomycetota bacterium]